ncbi:MAG TPA: DUF421 domain-containing protein [Candidatus Caccalectryoclostridium excrementigallinarum]|uniref:DUF421 domain-containing protein n=1 Tax=Candidatus Caccalectryoclostridium excrementigallinarum TaxID=2840710 RepID=A0A9D1MMY0_9FIRM|nr:DUF421 domain-containing protein [Candidatus Caccalectryoclostridium excrementigallinarum]
MLIVFVRAILIYIFLLVAMRLMGKKQLGELQPFEFAVTLIMAELACIPMSDTTVPVIYGLVPIFTLFIVQFALTKLIKHSLKARRLINGKPVIVINPCGIDYRAISMLDLTVNDLLEALREKNYLSPEELEYAIFETNGDVSVIPKARPLTTEDMHLNAPPAQLPYAVICEGKKMSDNIRKGKIDYALVEKVLKAHDLKQKNVLLMTVTGGENFYLQPKSGRYITGRLEEENAG